MKEERKIKCPMMSLSLLVMGMWTTGFCVLRVNAGSGASRRVALWHLGLGVRVLCKMGRGPGLWLPSSSLRLLRRQVLPLHCGHWTYLLYHDLEEEVVDNN